MGLKHLITCVITFNYIKIDILKDVIPNTIETRNFLDFNFIFF